MYDAVAYQVRRRCHSIRGGIFHGERGSESADYYARASRLTSHVVATMDGTLSLSVSHSQTKEFVLLLKRNGKLRITYICRSNEEENNRCSENI